MQAGVEMERHARAVETTPDQCQAMSISSRKLFLNKSSPVTFDNVAKALEAFEATLITPGFASINFLKVMRMLLIHEKDGLKLFMDKGAARMV